MTLVNSRMPIVLIRTLYVILFACGIAFTLSPLESELTFAEETAGTAHQDGGEEDEEKKEEEEEKIEDEFDPELAKRVKGLFAATKVEFPKKDRVALTYAFKNREVFIGEDFSPNIEKSEKSIRFSKRGDLYRIGTDLDHHGVVFYKAGMWFHKALWEEVDVEVDFVHLSEVMKPGNLLCVAYAWNKDRYFIASNLGEQIVEFNRSLRVKRAIPAKFPLIDSGKLRQFGFKLKNGIFESTVSSRPRHSTDGHRKFLKKLGPGRIGLAWQGSLIKGIVHELRITGRLDPKWLEKALQDAN